MEAQFWHKRWESDQLGFHQPEGNPMLAAHFDRLGLAPGARVFVPLCGKTRDIGWLLSKGMTVVGAELSEIAVRDLFRDLGVTPEVTTHGSLKKYAAPGLDIFVGDIFDLDAATLGKIDATYDRAACVALPDGMRARYAAHLIDITARAPQLLITFDYDQSAMPGPPFSVPADAVAGLYAAHYSITELAAEPVEGKLKGQVEAIETIQLLV